MGKLQDLTGQKFGRLTVIKRIENKRIASRQIVQYMCLCECGQKVKVTADHLRNGDTKSCGCLQKELAKKGCKATVNQILVYIQYGRI